jgi:hypothetical protein
MLSGNRAWHKNIFVSGEREQLILEPGSSEALQNITSDT